MDVPRKHKLFACAKRDYTEGELVGNIGGFAVGVPKRTRRVTEEQSGYNEPGGDCRARDVLNQSHFGSDPPFAHRLSYSENQVFHCSVMGIIGTAKNRHFYRFGWDPVHFCKLASPYLYIQCTNPHNNEPTRAEFREGDVASIAMAFNNPAFKIVREFGEDRYKGLYRAGSLAIAVEAASFHDVKPGCPPIQLHRGDYVQVVCAMESQQVADILGRMQCTMSDVNCETQFDHNYLLCCWFHSLKLRKF